MKNPFVKHNNNNAVIALSLTGAAAVGVIAYLFLTDNGNETRDKVSNLLSKEFDKLSKLIKDNFKDIASGIVSNKTNVNKGTVRAVADHVVKS